MSHADFIHLRVHTAYSLSEGAIKVKELVKLAEASAMPAVAITDTNNLFGALEFSNACKDAGVQPIIGCQLAVHWDPSADRPDRPPQLDWITLLAQDETGYGNLMKLVSRAFLETDPGQRAHVSRDLLAAHNAGLIALSGGPAGPVGRLLLGGQAEQAADALGTLARIFPDRLYMELSRFGTPEERTVEAPTIDLAFARDIPLVATNEAFFADADMYQAHDALLCVADSTYVAERNRRILTPEHRFKSAAEMRTLFADLPEACDNTLVIAQRCAVAAVNRAPILPAFVSEAGRSEAEELRAAAHDGLEARLSLHVFTAEMDDAAREEAAKPYRDRLAFELDVIEDMGFPGYFLIVADFIKWAKAQDIPVGPGRGSGAGSVVAWALTITDLDPLRWGLLFERFLNPERVSMPDFDIDFCQERRDEVITYVQQKYGRDKVAQIITFGKLQARAVLRDVGRVLQMPYGQVDRICKLVPNNPASPVTLAQAIDGEPLLQDMRDDDESVARLIDMALKLEGLYRHASTHAAGVVIGDRPLDELVPLYRDPRSDMPVTQFNMKEVERAGLVKFDFLGLKTLSVLANAETLLRERGVEIDITTIPLDDRKTFDMLSTGEATGVFQLESSGMRDVLRRMKPDRFEDIIAIVALYRPGPMENIPSYIARKQGQETPDYLYPTLEPILKETFGIMIYQEQVMQIAQVLSGYTLGGADLLRRAMGKKIKAEMDAQRDSFVKGAVERGVDKNQADHIFALVEKFAGYGFNKSHAAAYALVAYQTAYLKANYPVEFFAASMTFDMGNADKLNAFRRELQRLGIELLPPDVNASRARFSVENGAIRYALGALKNVGVQAMESLVAERTAEGPFTSVADFARRLDNSVLNKRQMENLVRAGAFDGLNRNRRQIHDGIDAVLRLASTVASERASGTSNLFGDMETPEDLLRLPDVPDWPVTDRLRHEFEAVGLYLSAHPLDDYRQSLKRLSVVGSAELAALAARGRHPSKTTLAGTVIGRKERRSAKGNKFAFVQLSDSSGMYEVTLFSEILATSRDLLDQSQELGKPLLLRVDVKVEDENIRLLAEGISSLDSAVANTAAGLKVYLTTPDAVTPFRSVLEREKTGRGEIYIVCPWNGTGETEIRIRERYAVSPQMRQAIKSIPGIMHVEEV